MSITCAAAAAAAAILLQACQPAPSDPGPPVVTPSEIQYLLFQYSANLFKEDPNYQGAAFNSADLGRWMDGLLSSLGNAKGDGKSSQLGFAVGPLSFDQTDAEIRTTISQSFAVAEQKGVAVGFHIDDSMFWVKRSDLWSVPANVERGDWNGTPIPHRFVIWAPAELAPQMCYNSPAIVAEVGRIAGVIGAEIRRGVDHLAAVGKPHLFAGVIAGWETMLNDYRYMPSDAQPLLPHVRMGYCALTNLGYSAANPPADYDVVLEGVVHDWAELWARSLGAGGVSADRIYTHIADNYVTPAQVQASVAALSRVCNCQGSILGTTHARTSTAFSRYSRPGFTTYPGGSLENGVDVSISGILQERPLHGSPHWASSEGFNLSPFSQRSEITWDKYLGDIFKNGATVVNIFAAGPNTAEAIQAYSKFLTAASP